jgi:hypothetical protein
MVSSAKIHRDVETTRLVLIIFIFVVLSIAHVSNASAEEPEPTREQLQVQINIMRDYIKRLQSELNSHPGMVTNQDLEKAYVATRLKSTGPRLDPIQATIISIRAH